MTPAELSELLARNLPVVDHRGEVVEEVTRDAVRLRLPVLDTYLSHDLPPGSGQVVLSGPIAMGFAETAMYACVHAVYGPRVLAVTLSLTVSFLRLAGGDDLIGVARLLERGRGVAFVEVHLYSGDAREPCAHATANYAIRNLDAPR
jgi:acyl-coenzyme A thioesterase PaaI-like protein